MSDQLSEDIKKILEYGIMAPSGENCQPWRFEVKNNQIHIFNIPERDQSPYNFRQRGSLISHGALIENIIITSSSLGFKAEVHLFPENSNKNLVAIVSLEQSLSQEEPLFYSITKRVTNRKPYSQTSLGAEQLTEILNSATGIKNIKLLITEDKKDIETLSLVGSLNERLVLENEILHNFLFNHINWTKEENEKKKVGFYIKTLELPPPARIAFKIFSYWNILKRINRIGISKMIWKQNGDVYASSAAIGVLVLEGISDEDFVNIGKVTERVWLTVTKLGLSFQPMTGTFFFMQRILNQEYEPFSKDQVDLIKTAYANVQKIFKLNTGLVVMMFRIGRCNPPSARALRLKPEIIFK